nr:unnamed protein product [Spirometra erinaceieuropaei]
MQVPRSGEHFIFLMVTSSLLAVVSQPFPNSEARNPWAFTLRPLIKRSNILTTESFAQYLHNPFLINNSKFDLRIYVFVYSLKPLCVFVHEDGLARFASQKSLKALWSYLRSQGIDTDKVWADIKDVVVKTCLATESLLKAAVDTYCVSTFSVQELFGFDIFLDENLKPWLLEVNVSPSMHSDSPLDVKVKGTMIKDMLNLTGIRLPEHKDINNPTVRTVPTPKTSSPVPNSANAAATKRSSDDAAGAKTDPAASALDAQKPEDFATAWSRSPEILGHIIPAPVLIPPPPPPKDHSTPVPKEAKRPTAPSHPWLLDRRLTMTPLSEDERYKHEYYILRAYEAGFPALEPRSTRKVTSKVQSLVRTTCDRKLSETRTTATSKGVTSVVSRSSASSPPAAGGWKTSPSFVRSVESTDPSAATTTSSMNGVRACSQSEGVGPESIDLEALIQSRAEHKRKMEEKASQKRLLQKAVVRTVPVEQAALSKPVNTEEPKVKNRNSTSHTASPTGAPSPQLPMDPTERFEWMVEGIFDHLTPYDVRCLVEVLDLLNRAGDFQCAFPCHNAQMSAEYLAYFEKPRYANLLVAAFLHYHGSSARGWLRSIIPKTALKVEEEAWNAYPYTKTRYRVPFMEKFTLELETKYLDDGGDRDDVFELTPEEKNERIVDFIDIVTDPLAVTKPSENPATFVSEVTGRGPLSRSWREEFKQAVLTGEKYPSMGTKPDRTGSVTKEPLPKRIMCSYKLCRVNFAYWGMQSKIESFIHDIAIRRTMVSAHRQAWTWQDEWYGLTMAEIRRLEAETAKALAEKMNAAGHNSPVADDSEVINSAPSDDAPIHPESSNDPSAAAPLFGSCMSFNSEAGKGTSILHSIENSEDEDFFDARSLSVNGISSEGVNASASDVTVNEQTIAPIGPEDFHHRLPSDVGPGPTILLFVVHGDPLSSTAPSSTSSRLVRSFVPLGCIPLLFTNSRKYAQDLHTLCETLNEQYVTFCESAAGKNFSGCVSVVADNIGSILLYDLLTAGELPSTPLSPSNRHSVSGANKPIQDVFTFGSSLGLLLAYRCQLGGRTDNSNGDGPSLNRLSCEQVFNLFHLADPFAYRLEPLLHPAFANIPVIHLPAYPKRQSDLLEGIDMVGTIARNSSLFQQRLSEDAPASVPSATPEELSTLAEQIVIWLAYIAAEASGSPHVLLAANYFA